MTLGLALMRLESAVVSLGSVDVSSGLVLVNLGSVDVGLGAVLGSSRWVLPGSM